MVSDMKLDENLNRETITSKISFTFFRSHASVTLIALSILAHFEASENRRHQILF